MVSVFRLGMGENFCDKWCLVVMFYVKVFEVIFLELDILIEC